MDVVQIICYRLWNAVLDLLKLIGIAITPPLYSYDSSECARDIDTAVSVFKGTYRQVHKPPSLNVYICRPLMR